MKEIKVRKRRMRCDICGNLRLDAVRQINPYDDDINGVQNWQRICHDCYQNLCDGI